MRHASRFTILLSLFMLAAPAGYACTCTAPSQRRAFGRAAAVFVGEVIKIEDSAVPLSKAKGFPAFSVAVTLKVSTYWKGADSSQLTIHTDQGVLGCRTGRFVLGQTYLVYAEGPQLIAYADCARNVLYDPKLEDLKKLGRGKTPKPRKEQN